MALEPLGDIADAYAKKQADKKFDEKWGTDEGKANLYESYLLQQESGLGSETGLMRKLRKAGLLDAEGNVIAPEGYGGGFDPSDPNFAADPDKYRDALKGGGGNFRESVYQKKWDKYRAELAKNKMDEFKASTIDPLTKNISSQLDEMLNNPALSPEELADMRSEMVSQARSQEAERLKRVGASLGIRGLDPGSIAGAALANRVAEDTDRRISEGLRRFNLDIAEMERTSQVQELGLGTSLATQMAQLETALTQGNLEQVFGISNDLGAILEAINSQDAALKAQSEAARLGFYGAAAGGVAQGAGAAAGGIF